MTKDITPQGGWLPEIPVKAEPALPDPPQLTEVVRPLAVPYSGTVPQTK